MNKEKTNTFIHSLPGSKEEAHFLENEMSAFYSKKLRKHYEELLTDSNPNITKEPSHKMRNLILVLTGCIVLLLTIYFVTKSAFKSAEPSNIQIAMVQKPDVDLNERGALSMNEKIYLINQSLTAENYTEATELAQTIDFDSLGTNTLLLLSYGYYKVDKFESAIHSIDNILSRKEHKYSDHQAARWLKATMLYSKNRNEEMIPVLKDIKLGQYQYEEAQKALLSIE